MNAHGLFTRGSITQRCWSWLQIFFASIHTKFIDESEAILSPEGSKNLPQIEAGPLAPELSRYTCMLPIPQVDAPMAQLQNIFNKPRRAKELKESTRWTARRRTMTQERNLNRKGSCIWHQFKTRCLATKRQECLHGREQTTPSRISSRKKWRSTT